MPELVTLEIADDVLKRARAFAASGQRSLESVLAEWIDRASHEIPVKLLPDDEVLALSNLMMTDDQQQELSKLLNRNHEGLLDDASKARFDELMASYRRGLVRKAEAIQVAVERGLRPHIS